MENIEKKLIEIQNELKCPKNNFNSFGKYKYRSSEDILEAVKPIAYKKNTLITLSDKIISIGGTLFLKSTAKATYLGASITAYGYAQLSEHKGMSMEQCTGTASSYARKYALNGLLLIDETEQDADSVNKGVDVELAKSKIITAVDVADLKNKFFSLSKNEQENKEVIELVNKIKKSFEK